MRIGSDQRCDYDLWNYTSVEWTRRVFFFVLAWNASNSCADFLYSANHISLDSSHMIEIHNLINVCPQFRRSIKWFNQYVNRLECVTSNWWWTALAHLASACLWIFKLISLPIEIISRNFNLESQSYANNILSLLAADWRWQFFGFISWFTNTHQYL